MVIAVITEVNLAGIRGVSEAGPEGLVGVRSGIHREMGLGRGPGPSPEKKNSSYDDISNVNFYAVRPEAIRIR